MRKLLFRPPADGGGHGRRRGHRLRNPSASPSTSPPVGETSLVEGMAGMIDLESTRHLVADRESRTVSSTDSESSATATAAGTSLLVRGLCPSRNTSRWSVGGEHRLQERLTEIAPRIAVPQDRRRLRQVITGRVPAGEGGLVHAEQADDPERHPAQGDQRRDRSRHLGRSRSVLVGRRDARRAAAGCQPSRGARGTAGRPLRRRAHRPRPRSTTSICHAVSGGADNSERTIPAHEFHPLGHRTGRVGGKWPVHGRMLRAWANRPAQSTAPPSMA